MSKPKSHILLTGPPGIGKTTAIKKMCANLQAKGIPLNGFYTEEVRQNGSRIGFDVVSVHGERGELARITSLSAPTSKRYQVGNYVVNVQSFAQIATPILENAGNCKVLILDEIGKMELFAPKFSQLVSTAFENAEGGDNYNIIATIPMTKGRPFGLYQELITRRDTRLFSVDRQNRDELPDKLQEWINL